MKMQLSKDTGKFWSFKDTKHYKKANYKYLCNSETQRRFMFEKSYLLEVYIKEKDEYHVTIPLHFKTDSFPNGNYCGITSEKLRIYFCDDDIVRVIG